MKNDSIIQRDLKHIWHPCTQMSDHEGALPLIPIKRGKGIYLYDFENKSYIDAISSWWVNIFGHSNDYINSKLKAQVEELEHIIFAGFSHEPIVKLSERLVNLTPEGLNKCFYADNGSSAIEVALKMSFHYHKNLGEIKPLFVSLTNSYHGETLGTLSIGDVSLYKEVYNEILIETIHSPHPINDSEDEAIKASLELRKLIEKNLEKISAVIFEPLVQCAGYMKMHHPIFLKLVRDICDEFKIHLILDEIAVGFGRTGTMFACESADITPDFLVLSKGLTGGYLPLSVVLTNDNIYNAFYCDYRKYNRTFLHSHSYTGNPLACAVANATLDIFAKDNVIEKNREKIEYMREKSKIFKELKYVKEVRQRGMILAIELDGYKDERVNLKIYNYALKNGVLLRPLSNIVYFMPPYVITKEEIDKIFRVAYEAISNLS